MILSYLKPTNYCNIDCEHCYLPKEVRANKSKMDDETLRSSFSLIKNLAIKNNTKDVMILWHGGEPLILPPEYFINASEIIDSIFKDYNLIEAVQTSLIPYRAEFSKLVHKRWGGQIGSSIDFTSRLVRGSTDEYMKLWLSKVELARSDDILIVPGMVPSKLDCANSDFIYKWFVEHDFWIWGLDRYSNFINTLPNVPTNFEHSTFLIGLFDNVVKDIKSKGIAPHIKPVAACLMGVLYGLPSDRWGSTCQSDFVVINPDGSLNSCPDRSSFEKSYGSLSGGIDSFVDSPLRKKWIRIQQAGHRISDCYDCENSTWCKSGCPITGNACKINNVIDECSGFKRFISHVRSFVNDSEENKVMMKKYVNLELTPKFKGVKLIDSPN